MKVLAENEFVRVLYDEEQRLLSDDWKLATEKMQGDEDFKRSLMQLRTAGETLGCRWLLTNTLHLEYPVHPDLQQWAFSHVIQHLVAAGVEKQAFVMPTDLFAHVAVEQYTEAAEETNTKAGFQIKHFDNINDAMAWLKT